MALPSVAIIIPTKNRPELLIRSLGSILPYVSSHPNCSIIVSDDGNSSETRNLLVRELAAVQIVQGPRRGPSANRNCGAAHATAELLIFLDDDCIPDQNLIAAYQNAAMANPEIGVFEGRITAKGDLSSFADAVPENETGGYLWSCNFAIRRDLFLRINGFDERFPFAAMEDVDLHFRVKNHSKILFLPDARVWHEIEFRHGWRIVKHHTLSVLLFLHANGLESSGKTSTYFLRMAVRKLIFTGARHLRSGKLKYSDQLFFQIWANLQLALIVFFWRYHSLLARCFYTPCCKGCESIHAAIASPNHSAVPLKEGTDAH
jgi:GT2 family glycosyltransferase